MMCGPIYKKNSYRPGKSWQQNFDFENSRKKEFILQIQGTVFFNDYFKFTIKFCKWTFLSKNVLSKEKCSYFLLSFSGFP